MREGNCKKFLPGLSTLNIPSTEQEPVDFCIMYTVWDKIVSDFHIQQKSTVWVSKSNKDTFTWHSESNLKFFLPTCVPCCSCALLAELQGSVRQLERAALGPQQGHPYGHQRGGGQAARHPADLSSGLQHTLLAADCQWPGHLPTHHQHIPGSLLSFDLSKSVL